MSILRRMATDAADPTKEISRPIRLLVEAAAARVDACTDDETRTLCEADQVKILRAGMTTMTSAQAAELAKLFGDP